MKSHILLAALVLGACAQQPPRSAANVAAAPQTADLAMFQARIERQYVAPFMAGEVEQWLLIFDTDVVALHNRMPTMQGKESLRQFATFVRDNLTVVDMSVVLEGVRRDGDLAYTWGRYHSRLLMKPSGESMPGHSEDGKVLFVWKLQADGSWKIAVDMGNSLPAQ